MDLKVLEDKKERLVRAINFRIRVEQELAVGDLLEQQIAFKLAAISQRLASLRRELIGYRQEEARLEAEIDAAKDSPHGASRAKEGDDLA